MVSIVSNKVCAARAKTWLTNIAIFETCSCASFESYDVGIEQWELVERLGFSQHYALVVVIEVGVASVGWCVDPNAHVVMLRIVIILRTKSFAILESAAKWSIRR